jgi:hypothetical protein
MINFQCPHCGNPIEVADTDAGRAGNCHGCRKRITVPRPVIVVDSEAEAVLEAPEDDTTAKPPKPPA